MTGQKQIEETQIKYSQNKKKIIHPVDNTEIYRNQFYKLKQNATQTFSDFYFEILHIYELCKFEDEGRCTDHKNCSYCKKGIKDA